MGERLYIYSEKKGKEIEIEKIEVIGKREEENLYKIITTQGEELIEKRKGTIKIYRKGGRII